MDTAPVRQRRYGLAGPNPVIRALPTGILSAPCFPRFAGRLWDDLDLARSPLKIGAFVLQNGDVDAQFGV